MVGPTLPPVKLPMGADTRVGVHRARPYRISSEVHRRYEASVPLAITSPTTNGLEPLHGRHSQLKGILTLVPQI